ncbi:MAG: YafY family transcriptional regulator [Balneolaceae bacterium]|nr:YafY family transcriptional regulator [Balneolaceae bacterium]
MNRIDRLTAIIIFLQGRKGVRVEKLAERYNISKRTVFRDLKALQEAGVPIGSDPDRGYFIVKGYHLPPVSFSKEEAASLLAGERLMQKWNDTELGKSYHSALDKIRSILPSEEKEYFESMEESIRTFSYSTTNIPSPDGQIFSFLQNVIYKKEVIEIDYTAHYRQQTTRRKVEPLGLLLMGSNWYLAAWCKLREDYRMFRLDRFNEYKRTGIKLRQPPEHTLKDYFDQNLHQEKELHEVVVWFSNDIARYVGEQKYWHGWAWEEFKDEGVEMTFLCSSIEYFCHWLMIWGNGIVIKKSDRVKKRVKELADELYRHHR